MYKETCRTTKFIDFKIQKYSLSMTIQYHSDAVILFLSHSAHSVHHQILMGNTNVCWDVSHGIPIEMTFLWTSLTISTGIPNLGVCCKKWSNWTFGVGQKIRLRLPLLLGIRLHPKTSDSYDSDSAALLGIIQWNQVQTNCSVNYVFLILLQIVRGDVVADENQQVSLNTVHYTLQRNSFNLPTSFSPRFCSGYENIENVHGKGRESSAAWKLRRWARSNRFYGKKRFIKQCICSGELRLGSPKQGW